MFSVSTFSKIYALIQVVLLLLLYSSPRQLPSPSPSQTGGGIRVRILFTLGGLSGPDIKSVRLDLLQIVANME